MTGDMPPRQDPLSMAQRSGSTREELDAKWDALDAKYAALVSEADDSLQAVETFFRLLLLVPLLLLLLAMAIAPYAA